MDSKPHPGRPVVFGEVLFDCFDTGHEILGGAPFNVAWHLQGFGLQPLFISRLGEDELGRRVRETMQAWGMDLRGVQSDPAHPTGRVNIQQRGASHSFDILPDQAYDQIDADTAEAAVAEQPVSLLYLGSLARRAKPSRRASRALAQGGYPSFVDVNLRPPWWEWDQVEALLKQSRWFKLNDDELDTLVPGDQPQLDKARGLRTRYSIDLLILTRGQQGAVLIGQDETHQAQPPPVTELADTVGAGDAFSAVVILGLTHGWPLEQTLQRALDFAARICAQRGATARDPDLYRQYQEAWRL